MNCDLCLAVKSDKRCYVCKENQLIHDWIYELDNGTRMCKCPSCEGRMIIDSYTIKNPYRYCPYCGKRNINYEQLSLLDI